MAVWELERPQDREFHAAILKRENSKKHTLKN
jgi:hypothetical protein